MLHLASLQACHDASSFPVPDDINLQTTPCQYQFKCTTSGTANDKFHMSLNELKSILQDFAVCLPSPVSTSVLTVFVQDDIDSAPLTTTMQSQCNHKPIPQDTCTAWLAANDGNQGHSCQPGVSKLAAIIACAITQWGLDDNNTQYIAEKLLQLHTSTATPEQLNGQHERSKLAHIISLGRRFFSRH